ncbi:MAG: hypothetical protein C0613_00650 [Desulfobulbaceae bacterium]|nr:MAG: hypothetical protein C0613_00650 [Desulfobulbaceae bacterium]
MKLQNKISLIVLPCVAAVILLLGLWAMRTSDKFFVTVMHEIIGTNLDVYMGSTLENIVAEANDPEDPAALLAAQQRAFAEAKKEHLLETGHIFIVDRQGELLFCSRGHDHLLAAHIWLPVVRFVSNKANSASDIFTGEKHRHGLLRGVTAGDKEVMRGTTRMLQGHAHLAGGDVLYSAAFFEPWQWVVISTIKDQELHALIGSMQRATAAATLITVLGAFALLALVMRHLFVKPVTLLQRAAREIADHHPVKVVEVHSDDELGCLARSMEKLSAAQQRHDQEQARSQAQLELQVAERTRELQRSNEALRNEAFHRHTAFKKAERLIHALDQSLDGVFMFRPDTLRFFYVNQGAVRHLGYSVEELLTMTSVEVKPEFSQERFRRLLAPLMRGDKDFLNFKTIHQHKDGRPIPVEIIMQYVRQEDDDDFFIAIARDIEERQRAEDEKRELEKKLQQAQKMEAVGTLAGGIAHDFNNVLAAILGFGELAQAELAKESPVRGDIDQILVAGRRAQELVRQLLAFSRQSPGEKLPVYPQQIIKETIRLLRATLPSSVEMRTAISNECRPIMADPTQIHQVLLNLCVNAVHAMAEKGTLTISLEMVELADAEISHQPDMVAGSYVRLSVEDTGAGIAAEDLPRIFDPFFTTKEVGVGTGMGLAVVHGVVTEHDGMITVRSTPGHGTLFTVFLPVAAQDLQHEGERPLSVETDLAGIGHLLVVDDEEAILGMYKKSLEARGYMVTTAANGRYALDLFRAKPDGFDLLITDQTMPFLTGMELSKEILALRPDFPIFLCSGYSSSLDTSRIEGLGISRYMEKPLNLTTLAQEIKEVLRSRHNRQKRQ